MSDRLSHWVENDADRMLRRLAWHSLEARQITHPGQAPNHTHTHALMHARTPPCMHDPPHARMHGRTLPRMHPATPACMHPTKHAYVHPMHPRGHAYTTRQLSDHSRVPAVWCARRRAAAARGVRMPAIRLDHYDSPSDMIIAKVEGTGAGAARGEGGGTPITCHIAACQGRAGQ